MRDGHMDYLKGSLLCFATAVVMVVSLACFVKGDIVVPAVLLGIVCAVMGYDFGRAVSLYNSSRKPGMTGGWDEDRG